MEGKKFKHSLKETCFLCDQEIDTSSGDWGAIPEFKGKILFNIRFCHLRCLKDLMTANCEVMTRNFQKKLGNVLNGIISQTQKNNFTIS